MRRSLRSDTTGRNVAVAVLLVMSSVVSTQADPRWPTSALRADVAGGWTSRHIVVRFERSVIDRAKKSVTRQGSAPHSLEIDSLGPRLQALSRRWKATRIRRFYPYEFGNPQLASGYGLDRTYVIEVRDGTDTPKMAAEFRGLRDDVETADVDGLASLAQFFPNDPRFGQQYGLHNEGQTGGFFDADVDAPEAWSVHTGDYATVTIAFVDSGIDPHVEFAGRMVPGINTNNPETPDLTTDPVGHGTHGAGVAAAMGNNATGVAGVTWGALIMPVRFTNHRGSGSSAAAAAGIVWAADHGADICNLSVQFYNLLPASEETFRGAVNYAHDLGVLLIAAAGNEDTFMGRPPGPVAAPARFENCIAVSATTDEDMLASFSNFGPKLDISAPGENIWSTQIGNSYMAMSGTSFAAPCVSGVAALVKSYAGQLSNDEIREVLTGSADDLDPPGRDIEFGYGRVNAFNALRSAGSMLGIASSHPPDGAIDASQPFAPDGSNPSGWRFVELTFPRSLLAEITLDDLTLSEVGGDGNAPAIESVTPVDGRPDTVTVTFAEPLEPGTWTKITHLPSESSVCLGYLPGNVNQDSTSSPASDLTALIDCFNLGGCDEWQNDIDRDGSADSLDVPRLIDLFNGAGAYLPWIGATLAPSPCD